VLLDFVQLFLIQVVAVAVEGVECLRALLLSLCSALAQLEAMATHSSSIWGR
jgi:hypothetical protein